MREKSERIREVEQVRLDGPLSEVLPRFNALRGDGVSVVMFAPVGLAYKVVLDIPESKR